MLARHNTPPQKAHKLMRHAKMETTMKYYTHLLHGDLAEALDKLPSMLPNEQEVKTGTCDVPEKCTLNSTLNPGKIEQNRVHAKQED